MLRMNHLRIKVCGVTTPADARRAALLGADAVGLNFYPKSPRYVDVPGAEQILRALPPFVEAAGVFVNQSLDDILNRTVNPLGMRLQVIQMHADSHQAHGDSPGRADLYPFRVIPAFRLRDRAHLEEITSYLDFCRENGRLPAAVLVDALVPGQYGGTGQTAPWDLLAGFEPGVPLILAGGLTPENVAEAVRTVRPYGVDVASGVESAPGRKDPDKMRRFIANAREAAAR
jgi:phosphoribosylanthranilate isomerase